MDITTALKTIQGYNVDILTEEKRVLGYITDLMPGDTKAQRRIRSAYESGTIKLLNKERATNKDTLFLKAVSCLSNYSDYEDELSEEIIGCFFQALNWHYNVQKKNKEPANNDLLEAQQQKTSPHADENKSMAKGGGGGGSSATKVPNGNTTRRVQSPIQTPVIPSLKKEAPPSINLETNKPATFEPRQEPQNTPKPIDKSSNLTTDTMRSVKSELKIKKDLLPFSGMLISLFVFVAAIFLGITILAELTPSGELGTLVSTALKYLTIDHIYLFIYICGALAIFFTSLYLYKVRSENFWGNLVMTLLFSGGIYLIIFILLNNPLEIILNFIGNIWLMIIGESEDVFKEGTGITTFVIVTALNYVVTVILKIILSVQKRELKRKLKVLKKQQ